MAQIPFYLRFTDYEYASKKEIANALGSSYVESVWRMAYDYREKFRFAITLKNFRGIPFSVVLTPAIMAKANSVERKMFEYSMLYERYQTKESVSDNKVLDAYQKDITKSDLLSLAQAADLEVSSRDIDLMLEPASTHLKSGQIYGYYMALQYLLNEGRNVSINRNLVRDLHNKIKHITDRILHYRDHDNIDVSLAMDSGLDPKKIQGAPSNRILEFMDQLFDFYDSDFELSPFIIGAVMYAYILYILPFDGTSEYVAQLVFQKVLFEKGYGEAAYYMALPQYLVKKGKKLQEALENAKAESDLTYVIAFFCDTLKEALNWKITNIKTLEMPKPIRDEVKVVEKIVEVPVEKKVEVIKEVVKEVKVPVEKIVYVETTKANVLEKEAAAEEARNAALEDRKAIIEAKKVDAFGLEDKTSKQETSESTPATRPTYDFMEDPFADDTAYFNRFSKESKPEPKEEVKVEEVKPVQPRVEEPKDIEIRKASVSHGDMRPDVAKLIHLPPEQMAKGMVEINPLLRYHQALFYANHHDDGRYYTISQFKDFTDCAYETARTSMELLVSLHLYRKEQLKNKFVYTPNKIEVEDEQ